MKKIVGVVRDYNWVSFTHPSRRRIKVYGQIKLELSLDYLYEGLKTNPYIFSDMHLIAKDMGEVLNINKLKDIFSEVFLDCINLNNILFCVTYYNMFANFMVTLPLKKSYNLKKLQKRVPKGTILYKT